MVEAAIFGGFVLCNDMDVSLACLLLATATKPVHCIRLVGGIRGQCRLLQCGPGAADPEASFKKAEDAAAGKLVHVETEREQLKGHLRLLQKQQPQVILFKLLWVSFFNQSFHGKQNPAEIDRTKNAIADLSSHATSLMHTVR